VESVGVHEDRQRLCTETYIENISSFSVGARGKPNACDRRGEGLNDRKLKLNEYGTVKTELNETKKKINELSARTFYYILLATINCTSYNIVHTRRFIYICVCVCVCVCVFMYYVFIIIGLVSYFCRLRTRHKATPITCLHVTNPSADKTGTSVYKYVQPSP
jgi:hypothetical protein